MNELLFMSGSVCVVDKLLDCVVDRPFSTLASDAFDCDGRLERSLLLVPVSELLLESCVASGVWSSFSAICVASKRVEVNAETMVIPSQYDGGIGSRFA
jgi:hypothetical protein